MCWNFDGIMRCITKPIFCHVKHLQSAASPEDRPILRSYDKEKKRKASQHVNFIRIHDVSNREAKLVLVPAGEYSPTKSEDRMSLHHQDDRSRVQSPGGRE